MADVELRRDRPPNTTPSLIAKEGDGDGHLARRRDSNLRQRRENCSGIANKTVLGQWNSLIQHDELGKKFRIISQWREALGSRCPITEYSDEAWGARVRRRDVAARRRAPAVFLTGSETTPKTYPTFVNLESFSRGARCGDDFGVVVARCGGGKNGRFSGCVRAVWKANGALESDRPGAAKSSKSI